MAKLLEMMDSSYHPTIKTLIGNVFHGNITLHDNITSFSQPNKTYYSLHPIKCLLHRIMWVPKLISDYVVLIKNMFFFLNLKHYKKPGTLTSICSHYRNNCLNWKLRDLFTLKHSSLHCFTRSSLSGPIANLTKGRHALWCYCRNFAICSLNR